MMEAHGEVVGSSIFANKNCWEFNNCGESKKLCAAYPNSGRSCAFIAGTAGNCQAVSFDEKHQKCVACAFYNSEHFDNPDAFAKKYGWRIPENLF